MATQEMQPTLMIFKWMIGATPANILRVHVQACRLPLLATMNDSLGTIYAGGSRREAFDVQTEMASTGCLGSNG
jgi:hypothetical protein